MTKKYNVTDFKRGLRTILNEIKITGEPVELVRFDEVFELRLKSKADTSPGGSTPVAKGKPIPPTFTDEELDAAMLTTQVNHDPIITPLKAPPQGDTLKDKGVRSADDE